MKKLFQWLIGSSISSSLIFPLFFVLISSSKQDGNSSNLDEIVNAEEGIDYFVLENEDTKNQKNWVTLPTTTNKNILTKYGNVMLPWKKDSEITHDDLVNMFTHTVELKKNFIPWNFGNRNIDSDKLANAYADWITTNWIKYPYVSGGDGLWAFWLKEENNIPINDFYKKEIFNNKDIIEKYNWKVRETMGGKEGFYIEDWINNKEKREEFNNFIKALFSRVRPGMNDLDKFYICLDSIVNYLSYEGDLGTPDYGINKKNNEDRHIGVCSSYSGLLAFSLNALSVKAIPIITNWLSMSNTRHAMHVCTWVFLDITGQDKEENKKWYVSDSSMFSYEGHGSDDTNSLHGSLTFADNIAAPFILNDVAGENRWEKNINYDYNTNRLNGLIWNTPYNSNKASIGKRNYSQYNLQFVDHDKKRSKYVFINGSWYVLIRENNLNVLKKISRNENGILNSSIIISEDWVNEKYKSILNEPNPFMTQINNKIIFMINQNEYNKKIIVVPIDESNNKGILNWNFAQEVLVPNFELGVDFKIDNLWYSYEKNSFFVRFKNELTNKYQNQEVKINKQQLEMIDNTQLLFENRKSFDIEMYAKYLKIILGNYDLNDKKHFLLEVDNIIEENKFSEDKNALFERLTEIINKASM